MAAETRGLGLQVDSMQFYADLLTEIRGESAPSSKNLHLKQNAIEWPKMIVTDAQDVYDKHSTEKGGLPQQKALTLVIATIREWLVNSGALIRWTADENMIMNGLTKDQKESRQHLARVLQNGEWSVQRDAALVHKKSASQSKRARGTQQTPTRPCSAKVARRVLYCGKLSHLVENATIRVIEQNMDVPMPQILEEIVEIEAIVDNPVLQSEFIFL